MKGETIIVALIGALATISSSFITKSCERQKAQVTLHGKVTASDDTNLSDLSVVLVRNDRPAERTELATQGGYSLALESELDGSRSTKLALYRGNNPVYNEIYDPYQKDIIIPSKTPPENRDKPKPTPVPSTEMNPITLLASVPPTKELLSAAFASCPGRADARPTLEGAATLLRCIGADKISLQGDIYISGLLKTGFEVTLWTEAYERKDRFSARFGAPLPGRPYFGSNDTYIEVSK